MFTKENRPNNLGIDRYKLTTYVWETALLHGSVTMMAEKPDDFSVHAEPHLDSLRGLDDPANTLTAAFNNARNCSLLLGHFLSLDQAEENIHQLDGAFRANLGTHGAAARVLHDGRLRAAAHETPATFGAALKHTRNEEVFAALRAGRPVAFGQIAGRLLRPLVNALNVSYSEEVERHADDPRRLHSVTYEFEKLARFTFLDNGPDAVPTVIRQSYSENKGRYQQSYSGPGTLENLNTHVFSWLADALRERSTDCDAAAPKAALIRDLGLDDLAAYAAPWTHDAVARAIRRGDHDDLLAGRTPVPQPGAMLAAAQTITGLPPGARATGSKGFLRLVK